MDKGARLTSLLQNLERLCSRDDTLALCFTEDECSQLRVLTSRILQCVTSQEKRIRDIVLKSGNYLSKLLHLLEHSKDRGTTLNLIYILTEAVGRSNTNKRLSLLVSRGIVQILFHVLVFESKQSESSEDLLVTVHRFLAKLGPKDSKFSVKARLYQTLGVTLNLLRNSCSHPRILLPVAQVLKLYCGDPVNASFLGKNGAVACMFKICAICQRRHLLLLKCSLEILARLVKSKNNATLAVGKGGVSILIDMFSDWHRFDSKNRHIGIRKAIVSALKNITEFKSGQQALVDADGVRILYIACQEEIDCSELESLICMASGIVRKCFPRSQLPLASLKSPFVFDLPAAEFGDNCNSAKIVPEEENCLDNDADVSSDDDDREVLKAFESEDEDDVGVSLENGYVRNWDDLMLSYRSFFPELWEYDTVIEKFDSANDVKRLLSSPLCPLNKPSCRSSVDLHKDDRSIINSCFTESSSAIANHGLNKNLQLNQMVGFQIPSSHLSVPDLFLSGKHSILSPGKESLENIWPIPSTQVGCASSNLSKGAAAFPCSPKVKRKNLSKAVSGKQKEKALSKNRPSKSLIDDWSLFDLNMSTSNLMLSRTDYREKIMGNACSDDEDDDEDALFFGRKEALDERIKDPAMYSALAAKTISVAKFNKISYPDLFGHSVPPFKEPLYEKKLGVQRQMILEDINRFLNPEQIIDRVVFDLDAMISKESGPTTLENDDEQRVSGKNNLSDSLMFNSLFESGNLRKVIQVRQYEYDLILTPDMNTNRFHQWFYFEVSNMERNVSYRFNIINCEKMNSQFNFGMQPVMFSVTEAMQGRPYWSRVGTKICYYKNHFVRSSQTTGGIRGKTYYTASFTIKFFHEGDVCYIAYHYPYTYTLLQYHLKRWEASHDPISIYLRYQVLCTSLSGNSVPLLTLTSQPSSYDKEGISLMKNRPYIFLTSRVHPGESNASWVMKGTIDFLLSDHPTAKVLRDTYIFKIVPMLNPDGVINGNHRCSLVAEDLNRRWFCPCPRRHPTIYHTKGLLQFLAGLDRAPLVFCDYHGHSRRKNVFLYGCSPSQSWLKEDFNNPAVLPNQAEDFGYKTLPKLLHSIAPAFALSNCSFSVERVKETTARVVVWRQMRVLRSYTMESTYCGCDQGIYKGKHISTRHLRKMGRKFVEALAKLKVKHSMNGSNIPDDITISNDSVAAVTGSDNLLDSSGSVSNPSDIDEYASSNEQDLENNLEDRSENQDV